MKTNADVLFLSHGGGPMPLLGDPDHEELVQSLRKVASVIKKPSAIVVISAHWEEPIASITAAAEPPLIYDYRGFPEESYRLKYPCLGEPDLAAKITKALGDAGVETVLDKQRGLDHGVFVPLMIMYPEADIPCVQVSLLNSLNPLEHIEMGRALQSLPLDDVLVIGSGFSFHNMGAFFAEETSESKDKNKAFESWLLETCSDQKIDEADRASRLVGWSDAPHARYCHPREEHLLPLHVCYGLAGVSCTETFELQILRKKSSMYLWSSR